MSCYDSKIQQINIQIAINALNIAVLIAKAVINGLISRVYRMYIL